MGEALDGDGRARQRELFRRALAGKAAGRAGFGLGTGRHAPSGDVRDAGAGDALPQQGRSSGKGIGPNKASGHKGGMGRQGSKRG